MNDIKLWIQESYNINTRLSFQSCLFITGNSGTGKTYMINKIVNDLDLYPTSIDSINCGSTSQIIDILHKNFVSSLIQILNNDNRRKIIIIDDYDILLSLDNTININFYNFILQNSNKYKHIPIIIIINNEVSKKLGDIKKKCKFIDSPTLGEYDIYDILQNYKKDITFEETLKIIRLSDYNLNKAIKILCDTNSNYYIEDIIRITDLYSNIFNKDKIMRILLKEQWIIPLNFHENLIYELMNNRRCLKKDKYGFYRRFILNFCYFDIFMYNNYEIGLEFFIYTIRELFDIPIYKKRCLKDINNNFMKMLSYLSLQKKNNKMSYNYKSSFPIHQISNYHLNVINRKFIY
jgi:hypothetical protein